MCGRGTTWLSAVGNESPDYTDITGDGEPELVYIEMQPDLDERPLRIRGTRCGPA